jgi:hypothetical protein
MINREDFPVKFEDLRNVNISLPFAEGESETTCPVSMKDIIEYLDWEAPGGKNAGGEMVIDFELKFLRTALVNETKYWVWSFLDEDDTECYVTVSLPPGGPPCIGYNDSFGLTPEQHIIANYFDIN